MGVGLALVLVFGLSFALMPTEKAKADEGNMQWLAQPGPGNSADYGVLVTNTNVLEFAVAADGTTMYAITGSNMNVGAAPWALYKSPNAGQQWIPINLSAVPNVDLGAAPGVQTAPLANVAVAPDNPAVVAISTFDASGAATATSDWVFITTDGGITWTRLPSLLKVGASTGADTRIVDLKVSPARSGTLLGREYLAAVSDDTAAVGSANGDSCLEIIGGNSATWADVGVGVGNVTIDVADFVACEFSPGYVGDRIVVGIGNTAAATNAYTYNTQSGAQLRNVNIDATAIDYDVAGVGNELVCGDIAMPMDYDFTTPGFERFWVSFAYNAAGPNGNVFRCDGPLPATNMQLAGNAIRSIAYSGTIIGGTMFAGTFALVPAAGSLVTQVLYTTGATTNIPSWLPSFKPPTGGGAAATNTWAYVRLSPNFLGDNTVYAGTRDGAAGFESAFSVSTNGGVTYDQESLIDTGVGAPENLVAFEGMWLTPDGTTLFVASNDGTSRLSVWKTSLPITPISWSRIFCVTTGGPGPGVLAINKAEWATKPEIYLFDTSAALGANALFASYDGGNIFSTRSIPAAGPNIGAASVESSKTLYIGIGANVLKSVNGGLVWGPAVPANVAAVNSVVPAGGGHVLVGGPAGNSISTDGGASFRPLTPFGLTAGGSFVVIPDEGYATNNLVYAADTAVNGDILRLDVVNGTAWENLAAPSGAVKVGVAMSNGALYGMTPGAFVAVPPPPSTAAVCDRTLGPHNAAGTITWNQMSVGTPIPAAATDYFTLFDVAANHVYAAQGGAAVPAIWAYNDYLATTVPVAISPANGATVPNDPVSGRALPVTVSWNVMGTSTGMVNTYFVFVWPKATGFTSALVLTTGNLGAFSTAPAVVLQNLLTPAGAAGNWVGLSGVEYQWLIQARNQVSGDAIDSNFSSPPPAAPSFIVAEGIPQREMTPALEVPPITVPPVTVPPAEVVSPAWIWAVVIIGAILVIAVIALIFTTRRTP